MKSNSRIAFCLIIAVTVCGILTPYARAFSGSNGRIVFQSKRGDHGGEKGNYEIYTINPDGSDPKRLTNNPKDDERPGFSPDGTKIVFTRRVSTEEDTNFDLYVMNANGTGETRLTNTPGREHAGQWSNDGTRIIYQCGNQGSGNICVMNANGSNQTQLTIPNNQDEVGPVWSPIGGKIAFSKGPVGSGEHKNYNVFIATISPSLELSNIVQLTNNNAPDFAAAWSPDASSIAFRSGRDDPVNASPNIYKMNADGSNQTQLTNDPKFDRGPAWSPDGTKIVFYSNRLQSDGTNSKHDIYVMNSSNGSNLINLTANNADEDFSPDWGVVGDGTPPPPTITPTNPPQPTNTIHPSPVPPSPTINISPSPRTTDPADANSDGVVNLADLTAVQNYFGTSSFPIIDPMPDGKIDIFDYTIVVSALYSNNPTATPTNGPSPTTGPTPTTGPSPTNPPPSPTPPNVPGEIRLIEWNQPALKSHSGFLEHKPAPDFAQGNWVSPVNYAEGKLHFRAKVVSMPVNQPKMKLGFCFWQGTNQNEPGWGEECADSQLVPGTPNSDVTWERTMNDLSPIGGASNHIDWTLNRWKYGMIVRNKNNKPVSKKVEPEWSGENPDNWYPLLLRFTVVLVKKDQVFSGWQHYGW